jgi:diguanylate cyclase (GGDEF)-like protein
MRSGKPTGSFSPHEVQRFIRPITFAAIVLMVGLIIEHFLEEDTLNISLIGYGMIVLAGTIINHIVIPRTADFRVSYGWSNAILSGVGLGLLPYFLPAHLLEITHLLIPIGVLAVAIIAGRPYAYACLLLSLALGLPISLHISAPTGPLLQSGLNIGMPFIMSAIITEAVLLIKETAQQNIHRLETINKVSREMMLSLDKEQTLALLDRTIKETLEADTYFIGLLRDNRIHLDLFYDDGQYYNGAQIPLEGTLSGWVIKEQRELFLPDLRRDVDLEGVKTVIIGREKTSLSWMGVPLTATNVRGLISLGSYQPNAFDSADMELLTSLAHHITLALDNTIRHAQVEEQARLDTLTGVYNHGYFLKRLAQQAAYATSAHEKLSLIMLDIDFFKQYNDTYGHLVGDRILKMLCTAIRHHIKQTDVVGRWGGEEFAISLPGAGGPQAVQVAKRICETMSTLQVEDRERKRIPVPTVSQGIAVYPVEADEIYRLIDLADQRLYDAKKRGRNQIEPDVSHWEQIEVDGIVRG